MYHALVRVGGQWTSFGLHVPLQEWTNFSVGLQHTHGNENVAYLFWENVRLNNVHDVESRVREEARLAREAQQLWDTGRLREAANDDGALNLARAIMLLRQTNGAVVV